MSGKDIRETVGLLAVVASLIFVGVEIRQGTAVARANTRQALVETSMDLILANAANPDLNAQLVEWKRSQAGEELDCDGAHAAACEWVFGILRHHENIFLQVEEGVVDESVFSTYGWRDSVYYRAGFFPSYWAQRGRSFDPRFTAALEAEYDLTP